MKNKVLSFIVAALGALFASAPASSVERNEIENRYKWDLTALYADEAAWTAAREALGLELPGLARWQGKLGESPASLLGALTDWDKANLRLDESRFLQELLRDKGVVVGRIDTRYTGGNISGTAESMQYDPYAAAVAPAIVATLNDYYRNTTVRHELDRLTHVLELLLERTPDSGELLRLQVFPPCVIADRVAAGGKRGRQQSDDAS